MPNADSLLAAERRFQAAHLASDVAVLSELIDDRARFTGPDGNLYTKEEDLGAHEKGYVRLTHVEVEDLQVLVTEHTGVTWFLGTLTGQVGDQTMVSRMRYTRAWTHDQAGWKIIAAHAIIVPD